MEDKIKELRNKYGIHDTRNDYTEEEIIKTSKQKIYYLLLYRMDNNVCLEYKQLYGYISKDRIPCVFLKDEKITDSHYIPVKRISELNEIKEGIYFNKEENEMFCTTDELQFCIDYFKEYSEKNIQNKIDELNKEIEKLSKIKKSEVIIKAF